MMLMPSIFGDSLFDNFWGSMKEPAYKSHQNWGKMTGMMQTDVKERENEYEVVMNLPGYNKEDVRGELKDGYLIITAKKSENREEKDENGRYIRQERYTGSCSRSLYVGENVELDDIKATFRDGTLNFIIPKKEAREVVEEKKYIAIEG